MKGDNIMKIGNKTYDVLKDVSLLWMPIFITFYGVLSTTWGFPYGEQILATLTGLNAALGAIVKYYKAQYDKAIIKELEDSDTDFEEEV